MAFNGYRQPVANSEFRRLRFVLPLHNVSVSDRDYNRDSNFISYISKLNNRRQQNPMWMKEQYDESFNVNSVIPHHPAAYISVKLVSPVNSPIICLS